ncbi:uncharacterized protein LOC124663271 [Lolium rigidum]|uniref:uncharacterized protein LOC124663271 n=1 Tax=Lolium rigidum TaxID=89674 RepID=UPI001F5D3B3B|nr:uncharacterized protein LOC124663271 [Lolium rigidum]
MSFFAASADELLAVESRGAISTKPRAGAGLSSRAHTWRLDCEHGTTKTETAVSTSSGSCHARLFRVEDAIALHYIFSTGVCTAIGCSKRGIGDLWMQMYFIDPVCCNSFKQKWFLTGLCFFV